jgi:PAS domain S-box-containing protein
MEKSNRDILKANESLKNENSYLQQKLTEVTKSIDAIKSGNIDALVISDEKTPKIYTENTSDKAYRKLIEEMHEGAVTLFEDGSIFYCNSCFAGMVNMPLQKVIGATFMNFVGESSREEVEYLLKKGNANSNKKEIRILTLDRKMIPVQMSVNPFSLESGPALGIIITDLTVQNENQEKLRFRTTQLEQKNEELQNANKELAFQNDEKEKRAAELILANQELAYQNDEKEKRAAELILANQELVYQNDEKEKRAAELISINKELAFQISERQKRSAELTIARIDVKELEGLNTHKENILATLSHDLRSPLASIISIADLLSESYETMDAESIKEMMDSLYKLSTDELSMLDYLLEWARIKYASDAFSPAEINLETYVTKVFGRLDENAASKNLRLRKEIEENIRVFVDAKMLLSILQNIISNSIKHSYEGGEIIVTAKRKAEKIIVEIRDNGAGMSDEIRGKLFTPQIVSLSKARKENKGAGIGLLLVKGFLDKIGGEIWVDSEEGKGSSFYFTLPLMKPPDILKISPTQQII